MEELILSQDGKIEQAIVDVGGFLGMGVHRIGLAFDEMQVMTNADNSDVRVYIDQTRETLEQRPEYQQLVHVARRGAFRPSVIVLVDRESRKGPLEKAQSVLGTEDVQSTEKESINGYLHGDRR